MMGRSVCKSQRERDKDLTRVGGVLGLEQQTTIRSSWTARSFQLP